MLPLLEKFLWQSRAGLEIKENALNEVEDQEADLKTKIRQLEEARDARLKGLADQAAAFTSQLGAAREVVAEAESELRRLRHAELACGFEIDQVRNRCRRDVNAAQVRLRELAEARSQLHDHGH